VDFVGLVAAVSAESVLAGFIHLMRREEGADLCRMKSVLNFETSLLFSQRQMEEQLIFQFFSHFKLVKEVQGPVKGVALF